MTIAEMREIVKKLKKLEKPRNPDGTITIPKHVWEKMLEMAEILKVPESE